MPFRQLFVFLHRYVGLAMAIFLVIAGLTGSAIAYYYELDAALNPQLYQPRATSPAAERLDIMQLRARLAAAMPEVVIRTVPLNTPADEAVPFYVGPRDHSVELENDEYFVDPYTGDVLGSRKWGDISQGMSNLMPFVYELHHTLALGAIGSWIFGLVAVLWSIDCFVGAYLTFPAIRKAKMQDSRSGRWWKDWGKAWLVKTGSLYKLTFTWHRASGLWVWGLLFVFAWSAVGLTWHKSVFHPVMKTLFPMEDYASLPDLEEEREIPAMDWDTALARGRELMAEQAEERNFKIESERRINFDGHHGVFRYQVLSSLDINSRYPSTTVWFRDDTGALVGFDAPTGQAVGNTVSTWLYALHFGAVGGRAYQAFVAIIGIIVSVLSISGVYLWWIKRRARSRRIARPAVTSTGA